MGLETAALIASLAGTAVGAAGTGYALSKGSPSLPDVKPPPPPPPVPPPPAAAPPPPTETEVDQGVAKAKRRRATAYGVEQTLLTSPIGNPNPGATSGRTLLGG